MVTIYALHQPTEIHLQRVKRTMRRQGAPVIRCTWRRGPLGLAWYALEGSHRLAACAALGLAPHIRRTLLQEDVHHDVGSLLTCPRPASDILASFDRHWRRSPEYYWIAYTFEDCTRRERVHSRHRSKCLCTERTKW